MARRRDIKSKKNLNSFDAANFGEVLRRNREKHGISLSEVANDLRVREDILDAVERCDFSKIPPQGYSRNMIKSYSRLLGLDANKITEMFLDAEYSYQLSKKRESIQQISAENKKRVPDTLSTYRKSRTPRQQLENKDNKKNINAFNDDENVEVVGKRKIHVYGNKYKNTPRARRELSKEDDIKRAGRQGFRPSSTEAKDLLGGDSYSEAKARLESRKRINMSDKSGYRDEANPFSADQTKKSNFLGGRKRIDRNEARSFTDQENPNFNPNGNLKNKEYQFMNVYQKKNPGAAQSRMMIPAIAAVVIILILILILVFFFVGKSQENDKTDVSNLNVVGISDVENQSNNNSEEDAQSAQQTEEPKEVEFKYKVKDGMTVYMEIYENNSSRPTLAREVKSGETNVFKVTDTLRFVTSKPEGVEIYVANELVTPTDEKGKGVYTYTLDFKNYLTQWKTKSLSGNSNKKTTQ